MRLIIDIQEYLYKSLLEYKKRGGLQISQIENYIINGTPIPDNATVCDITQIRAEIANEKGTFPKEHYIRIIDKYTKGERE